MEPDEPEPPGRRRPRRRPDCPPIGGEEGPPWELWRNREGFEEMTRRIQVVGLEDIESLMDSEEFEEFEDSKGCGDVDDLDNLGD